MVRVNLKDLIGKLDDVCRRTLEGAAGLCLSRTNYNVEIEHWLVKLLETPNTDAIAILRHNEIDSSRVISDLTKTIDKFKTGNSRPPALSPNLVDLVRSAWLLCSIDYGEAAVRSGHLICALLNDDTLARIAASASSEFDRISPEGLSRELRDITANSDEGSVALATGSAAPVDTSGKPKGPTKTPSLDQFTIDLTARARSGHIDPVLGRDHEIRQIIDILTRRRQNNPILTGEAGVGKTAVVEGFALRVAAGDVPPSIQNVKIHTLDLGLLQAGAGVKGEFENRLKGVIDEVKSSPTPIIMFIDEAHTMIGAGGAAGQSDAANLLKPALARGELRTIAATTWAEYKKYFEKDAALARRFQVVKVEEPDESSAIEMMRGLTSTLEQHHKVRILNEAVVDAVKLSSRYISGRQLPDKAVSLLDTACARIGLSQSSTPPAIEDCRRRIEQFGVSLGILNREQRAGADHREELDESERRKSEAEAELVALEERLGKEKELVGKIQEIHAKLAGGTIEATSPQAQSGKSAPSAASAAPSGDAKNAPPQEPLSDEEWSKLREELAALESQLTETQGEVPLVHPCVNASAIAETVAAWTGIPVGRMVANEINTVLNLKDLMEKSVVGKHTVWISSPRASGRLAQICRIRRLRSAYSCWLALAVSARPRPQLHLPNCSMAASRI